MPVKVRQRHKGEGGKAWKIVEKGGKVVGQSGTKTNAQKSARARNRAWAVKKGKGR